MSPSYTKLAKKATVALPLFAAALMATLLSPLTFALLIAYVGVKCWQELTGLERMHGYRVYISREKAFVVTGFSAAMITRVVNLPMTLAVSLGAIANDIFANIGGMLFGKKVFTKGLSRYSPNKSWEGAIIGVAAGTWFFSRFSRSFIPLPLRIVFGLIVNVVAVAGDLQESQMKRDIDIKDVGGALGEHGGWTDRVDSLLRSSVVGVILLVVLRLRKHAR